MNIMSSSRRGFLAGATNASLVGLAAAALPMASGAASAATQVRFGPGPLSGLPWHSGCSLSGIGAFEAYRGRRCDGYTMWNLHKTWTDIPSFNGGFSTLVKLPGRISRALSPFPDSNSAVDNPGLWDNAARGAYDGVHTLFAQKLAASGRTNVIVRIGWEHNHTFPWYSGGNPKGYKTAFRRIADILRRHNPTVLIDWTSVKKGYQKFSVLETYPGDDWVDIIGVDYYDGFPALNDQATWDKQHNALYHGGPWGLGAWLAFAKSRGKRLSLPEWGIPAGKSPGSKDNPFYIQKMFEFFTANATSIAYEHYFNQKPRHQLTPNDVNPLSSAKYKQLWGR
jgi:hypothetical protein